jgi:DNA-binding response OmpR family regulator
MGVLNGQTGKDGSVAKLECVLVVDEMSDTADVLQAVFEPRGVAVRRVRKIVTGQESGVRRPPSVIVLDAECAQGTGRLWPNVPQVIIGTIRTTESNHDPLADPPRRFLQKPFQFAELMKVIESLI